ncbi:MAG: nitroreductase family protein [Thermoguttaceae bacterium]|nr:nitroreductase family protein [Thermoguttaceae bacterium]
MDFFETIAKRTCYRGEFNDTPVSREILTKVVEAGIMAPSACNQQSPSFIAVDDPAVLARIAEVLPLPTCKTAKAAIVCVADERPVFNEISFYKEDCAAAVENMLLALTDFGYSSVWLDGVLRRDQVAERIADILNIPAGKRVQILLPIGVPAGEVPKSGRLPFEKRASFNSWNKQQ